jgi:hypothetical protein
MTHGDSIKTHPSLAEIFGPQPSFICLPYGATTKNSEMKITTAAATHVTENILKELNYEPPIKKGE